MIVFRYLYREVSQALQAVIGFVFLIFMSNQLILFLSKASEGRFPSDMVFKLVLILAPIFMSYLLPLGFFIAVIIAYSRLFADQEMVSFFVCGYSKKRLIYHTMLMALMMSVAIALMTLWLVPMLSKARVAVIHDQGVDTLIKTLTPKRFRQFSDGDYVVYTGGVDKAGNSTNLFVASRDKMTNGWTILNAKTGRLAIDEHTHQSNLVISEGELFREKKNNERELSTFSRLKAPIEKNANDFSANLATMSTKALFPITQKDKRKLSELHWRLAPPVMIFILALIALILSEVQPRKDKFSGLLPAIIIYALYAGLLFIGRDWLKSGVVPTWAGLWWVHLIFLLLALVLAVISKRKA